jgi:hypothetical protein
MRLAKQHVCGSSSGSFDSINNDGVRDSSLDVTSASWLEYWSGLGLMKCMMCHSSALADYGVVLLI